MPSRNDAIALLDRYIRIPTISRQVTADTVREVRTFWSDVGLDLEPIAPANGAGTPALYGEIPGPAGAKTVLLYGHYDVQPTGDLSRWRWEGVACDPFAPTYFLDGQPCDPRTLDDRTLDGVVCVAAEAPTTRGSTCPTFSERSTPRAPARSHGP
jgi:hypothetical protein